MLCRLNAKLTLKFLPRASQTKIHVFSLNSFWRFSSPPFLSYSLVHTLLLQCLHACPQYRLYALYCTPIPCCCQATFCVFRFIRISHIHQAGQIH